MGADQGKPNEREATGSSIDESFVLQAMQLIEHGTTIESQRSRQAKW